MTLRLNRGTEFWARVRRVSIVALGVVALLVSAAPATAAADQDVVIGLVLRRAPAGQTSDLARVDVDAALIGQTCTLTADVLNQISVNPGNDVTVATGGTQMVLVDVEAQAGVVTSGSMSVVAGDVVTFTLLMGPAETFSGHLSMGLSCEEPPASSTTTAPPTPDSPTTTAPAPATTTTTSTTTTSTTTTVPTVVETEIVVSPTPEPTQGEPTFTG